ncbi:hypothetical protein [Herbidospora cretacea]|uniref:hypothetical protein n=1 Tax=Herbidospora cretacea TaxID=28444 RepID=UPI0004C466C8|nr:hypothetical protein [Herbidospora cretacea]
MRVEISPHLYASPAYADEVAAMLRQFVKGRHVWVIGFADLEQLGAYLRREMVPKNAQVHQDLAREAVKQNAAYRAGSALPVVLTGDNVIRQVADLERCAVVVVEDNATDGCFLKAIAKVFGRADILRALADGRLEIRHGGGADGACRIAREEHSTRVIPRVAALLDSDRLLPGDRPKSQEKFDALQARGVHVHVLEFRESENYIPNKALRAAKPLKESSERLSHLKTLSVVQRAHFDMKAGFKGGVPDRQLPLYADVPSHVLLGLQTGFGAKIIEVLGREANTLNQEDFDKLGPTVADEMHAILDMLGKIV